MSAIQALIQRIKCKSKPDDPGFDPQARANFENGYTGTK